MTARRTIWTTLCLLGLALACPCLPLCAGELSDAEMNDLFSQGKELFRQANELVKSDPDGARDLYRKSIMRFERIVREGDVHNGGLFYNIGNAYFRIEDIGRAVLNYRRALQYIPNDPNLQQNLGFARAKRLDRIEEKQKTKVLKTLFFWHYDLTSRTRSILFIVFWCLLWLTATLRLFVRRAGTGWGIVVTGILAALLFSSLATEALEHRRVRPGVIVSREVVARKGDSDTYEKSFTEPLHAGTEFRLLENRIDWLEIELADGRTCWVPANSAELVR